MLVGSAGRATGRVEGPEGATEGAREGATEGRGGAAGLGAEEGFRAAVARLAVDRLLEDAFLVALGDALGLDPLDAELVERLTAERFPSSFPARVEVGERLVVLRLGLADLDLGLLAARFASVFPARLAVMRFVEEVDFFADSFFAVDFFVEDFFFAGISPPSDGDACSPVGLSADEAIRCFLACYSIGSPQRQAVFSAPAASSTRWH
jgi:hypothetical protein